MVNVIVSSAGIQGPRGNAVLTGSGAPANTVGIDGDYYINTASYPTSAVLYGPRANGTWPGTGISLGSTAGVLLAINNLSDVASTATARTNLGLGGAATLNVGTGAGTVAAGNDTRIAAALQSGNNLSDVASAATSRTNLGLSTLTTAKANLTATTNPAAGSDNTLGYAVGSVWVNTTANTEYVCTNAATGAAVWTPILAIGTTAGTIASGSDSRITGALQAANSLSDVGSAATARTNLGLGTAASAGSATTGVQGIVQLAGDIGGTATSVSVLKVNGVTISGTPAAGNVPIATGPTAAPWTPIGVPLKSGWYYPSDGGGGNRTMTFNMLWIYPFDCQRAITIAKLACNVVNAGTAGSTIRLGVYSSDGAGSIGNLLVDGGTVAGDSTGVKTITMSTATGSDRLWLCAVWQGTNTSAPVLQAYSRPLPYIGWSSFVQFPPLIAYQYTGITGGLPATLPAPTSNENNNAPAVQFAPA